MNTIVRLVIIGACISLTGCAINRTTGTFDPSEDIVKSDIFYVERFNSDNRELHKLIADNISVRGYTVTFGEEGDAPDDATIIVTYVDKWMWDITMYLIELTITFRDPESGAAIGSGNSYHTSLSRLSPEEMVNEVLTNVFTADMEESSD
jgi:uncharacterized lipoprotein YajG